MTCERVHKRAGNTQQAVRSMPFCPKRAAMLLSALPPFALAGRPSGYSEMVSRLLHLVRLQEDLQVRVCALSCRLRRFFCFLSPQLFVIYVALDMPPFTDCRRASLKRRPRRTLQLCKLDRSLPLLGPTFWRATARTMCLVSSTEIRFLRERALVACQRFDAVKCFEDLLPATVRPCDAMSARCDG